MAILTGTAKLVHKQTSLGFFNRLFLVPKPDNKWRPILDLSNLNPFLRTEKFKMETPETIRTSLQQGEWVTSIDFKDAYFHIPIQEQSRKFLRFHIRDGTFQFKALPFGLSTAPMEFTIIAKEVKLMAVQKGIRIHQYLVGESHIPPGLSPTYTGPSTNVPRVRLAGEHRKVGAGTKTNFQFYCVNTTYLVDRCICPAPCRSRQTLEKNVLSWALAGTGSVLLTRQVAVQPTCRYTAHACACALPLFVWRVRI